MAVEETIQELQKEAAMQLATLQAESEQKIAQVKEELEDTQNAYEALKQEVERRDSVLATK